MQLTTEIYVNRCLCGWWFPALNKWETKCPQCRNELKHCIACDAIIRDDPVSNFCFHCRPRFRCVACGEEIQSLTAKFCRNCGELRTKILKKTYYENRVKKQKYFKDTEARICNYDCPNCPYGDCILPVDDENEQGRLF